MRLARFVRAAMALAMLVWPMMLLTGCHTLEGASRDVGALGRGVAEVSDDSAEAINEANPYK